MSRLSFVLVFGFSFDLFFFFSFDRISYENHRERDLWPPVASIGSTTPSSLRLVERRGPVRVLPSFTGFFLWIVLRVPTGLSYATRLGSLGLNGCFFFINEDQTRPPPPKKKKTNKENESFESSEVLLDRADDNKKGRR